ncbi:MAG: hypothetical protein R3F17_13860 [Planctomycetota bacterium]
MDPAPKALPVPTWYRDQIADLSDLAQRLHLDLFALEEGAHSDPAHLGALREDLARLTQFARTLGYLAAPMHGDQLFDLGTLVQEQLASLAGLGPEAPRFLFRAPQTCPVRSQKSLLVGALDAVLQVAGQAAGAHPATVRVQCQSHDGQAEVRIDFPAGPLAGFTAEDLFTPYRLKPILPGIGPNALAAARAILQGQDQGPRVGQRRGPSLLPGPPAPGEIGPTYSPIDGHLSAAPPSGAFSPQSPARCWVCTTRGSIQAACRALAPTSVSVPGPNGPPGIPRT